MSVLPLVFTSGWAGGINAYAVVLVLGVLGRTGAAGQVPAGLERLDVLAVAALLYVCEAVADKIPYVDSAWDAVHTVVRPVAAAVVAALLAGHDGSLPHLAAAAVGGGTALASHLVKAGLRMAVNTSPEPVSNVVLSLLEDLAVAALVALALFHPVAAATVAAVVLAAGLTAVVLLMRRIRRFWRRRRDKRAAARAGRAAPGTP